MKCKICGKNADSEYCFAHKNKKPLSSGKGLPRKAYTAKQSVESAIESLKKGIEYNKLKKFFTEQWDKRPHYCEVSGDFLGHSFSTIYQHHILPKSKYPEACLDEENIIFLGADIHANVENDMYKYEEINKRREQLKIKYEI
jgi:hypothetical protein